MTADNPCALLAGGLRRAASPARFSPVATVRIRIGGPEISAPDEARPHLDHRAADEVGGSRHDTAPDTLFAGHASNPTLRRYRGPQHYRRLRPQLAV